ncbi:hypothetical protein [Candidatus Regiella insecticola]|nr:hypothetical protein [Candidatus Regiella insecticola]
MRKLIIAVFVIILVSGCSSSNKSDVNPTYLNMTYFSNNLLPAFIEKKIVKGKKYQYIPVMNVNPDGWKKNMGTHLALIARITLNYIIYHEGKDSIKLSYYGDVSYLSTLKIGIFNVKQDIGGDVKKQFIIPAGSVTIKYGEDKIVGLTDDIKVQFQVTRQ